MSRQRERGRSGVSAAVDPQEWRDIRSQSGHKRTMEGRKTNRREGRHFRTHKRFVKCLLLKRLVFKKERKKEGKSLFRKPFGKGDILQDAEMHLPKSCHARGERGRSGVAGSDDSQNAGAFLSPLTQDTRTMKAGKLIGVKDSVLVPMKDSSNVFYLKDGLYSKKEERNKRKSLFWKPFGKLGPCPKDFARR
ncbi:hypothetical protein CEXT_723551 [Caerostris extrusa]|uniref:Uncharacterized protein n=1 Tax=Caerostris extrusa TaxID=172846 RepID=A0AAV4M4R5_CAEEX|nr:hypothetical protein CEXT_723551 [Caerostris extrusa]